MSQGMQDKMRQAAIIQGLDRARRTGERCNVYSTVENRGGGLQTYWWVRTASEGVPTHPSTLLQHVCNPAVTCPACHSNNHPSCLRDDPPEVQ